MKDQELTVETPKTTQNGDAMANLVSAITTMNQMMTIMADRILKLESKPAPAPVTVIQSTKKTLFGGDHTPKPQLDTETGLVYRTMGECGHAFEAEVPDPVKDPTNKLAYYRIIGKHPGRFQTISQEQYNDAVKAISDQK